MKKREGKSVLSSTTERFSVALLRTLGTLGSKKMQPQPQQQQQSHRHSHSSNNSKKTTQQQRKGTHVPSLPHRTLRGHCPGKQLDEQHYGTCPCPRGTGCRCTRANHDDMCRACRVSLTCAACVTVPGDKLPMPSSVCTSARHITLTPTLSRVTFKTWCRSGRKGKAVAVYQERLPAYTRTRTTAHVCRACRACRVACAACVGYECRGMNVSTLTGEPFFFFY